MEDRHIIQVAEKNAVPDWAWRILESAAPIAIATAFLYFVGFQYYSGFYDRLSFPMPYPDRGTNTYVLRGMTSLASWGFLALTGYMAWLMRERPVKLRQAAPGSASEKMLAASIQDWPVEATLMWLLLYARQFEDHTPELILISALAISLTANVAGYSLLSSFWKLPIALRISAVGFVVIFAALFFREAGQTDAKQLIEGEYENGTTVTLSMRDTESPLNGQSYLLVFADDEAFYLVMKQFPAPLPTTLLIVPRGDVKQAAVTGSP